MLIGLYLISARPRGQELLAPVYQQCLAIIYQLWGDWARTGVHHADAQMGSGCIDFPNQSTHLLWLKQPAVIRDAGRERAGQE